MGNDLAKEISTHQLALENLQGELASGFAAIEAETSEARAALQEYQVRKRAAREALSQGGRAYRQARHVAQRLAEDLRRSLAEIWAEHRRLCHQLSAAHRTTGKVPPELEQLQAARSLMIELKQAIDAQCDQPAVPDTEGTRKEDRIFDSARVDSGTDTDRQ